MFMVPLESIVVPREGKRVTPKIGAAFNFTADEVAFLQKNRPEAIRAVVNESAIPEELLEAEQPDEEIDALNQQAEEERNAAAIQAAGEKALTAHGAGKAVKAAKTAKTATQRVDDL